ncbi:MAG: tetratricopeptide repeat protein [Chloroflexi bacterium]|nr:tetratricopeptide repeat protein [Chloroflexota bacterium]
MGHPEDYLEGLWRDYDRAQELYRGGDVEEAAQILSELVRQEAPALLRAAVLNDLGVIRQEQGRGAEALHLYQRALEIEEGLGDPQRLSNLLFNLAAAYADQRRWPPAVAAYQRGLALLDERDPLMAGRACRRLGDAHLAQIGLPQQNQAIRWYRRSLEMFELAGDKQETAISLHHLARAYLAKDKWEEAVASYRQALSIWEALDDARGMAGAYLGLGQVHQEREDHQRAVVFLQKSLEIAQGGGDRAGEARAWSGLGQAYQGLRRWGEGLQAYQRALDLWEAQGDSREVARALWGRASLYFESGDRARAVEDMQRTVELLRRRGDPDLEAAERFLKRVRHGRPGLLGKYL